MKHGAPLGDVQTLRPLSSHLRERTRPFWLPKEFDRVESAAKKAGADAQGADADADGEGFAPGISGGSRSRTNKNAPRTRASEMATRMNAERVVLDPRIEGGAIADLGGGVLFGMPTRYNKGGRRFDSGARREGSQGPPTLARRPGHPAALTPGSEQRDEGDSIAGLG
jgi:hypothetical protein